MDTNRCSNATCRKPHKRGRRGYCPACHAAFQRKWRKVAFRRKLARLAKETGDRRFVAAVEAYDELKARGGKT